MSEKNSLDYLISIHDRTTMREERYQFFIVPRLGDILLLQGDQLSGQYKVVEVILEQKRATIVVQPHK